MSHLSTACDAVSQPFLEARTQNTGNLGQSIVAIYNLSAIQLPRSQIEACVLI